MKIEYPVITTETAELKRCPFCGEDELALRTVPNASKRQRYSYITCRMCGSRGPESIDVLWAISKWNTRQGEVIKNDRQGTTDVVGAIPGRC